ncbi:MAG: hypothetical protein A2176_13850 [Spirochaetes bacterium RBG_13_51_14]|nr:MAG: hypothetical protein A2176_13850 [Spirochaetes bacterium RBG_13_51_14]
MKKILIIPLVLLPFLWCLTAGTKQRTGGTRKITVDQGGRSRHSLLHIPLQTASCPCPLLIVLHGGGGTPRGMAGLTKNRFNELADIAGFYVAYPEGLKRSWNDFRNDTSSYAHEKKIDDVGFISGLIDRLAAEYPIDKGRVFVTGISNGGFMSFRLACELSGKIRGIAAVTATHPVDQEKNCAPSRPMNVLIINGTTDPIVHYNGGEVTLMGAGRGSILSTDDTVRFWVRFNRCQGGPETQDLPDRDPRDRTRVRRLSYGPCGAGTRVVLYRVENGGHTWPGGVRYLFTGIIGHTSRDINACDEIWEFFSGIQ